MSKLGERNLFLMIFPIEGDTDPELMVNLVDFLVNVLALPKTVVNGGSIEKIRCLGPTRLFPNEVLVIFKEIAVRDTVIGSSGMLSEMHDPVTKRSTADQRPCLLKSG